MRAKKRLGQHFLKNPHTVTRILDALEAVPGERFMEVGPGPGALTLPLHQRGHGLVAVEYDREMTRFLRRQALDERVTLVEGDFLDLHLDKLLREPIKVVANLPYNLSVPMTAHMLTAADRIPMMVLMYQKEVAERVRARENTKAYGPISVLVRQFYDIDLHFDVGPGNFRPQPKVWSQVLRLRRRAEPLLAQSDLALMTDLVRRLFQQRRKTLGNIIKRNAPDWSHPEILLECLQSRGYTPGARPEDLSPEAYACWLRAVRERHEAIVSK